MALIDDDRMQEFFLMVGDKLAPVNKKWWYALAIIAIVIIPFYFLLKSLFVNTFVAQYRAPQVTYSATINEPLQILDQKVFTLADNSYSGYVRIKNINLEWGIPDQQYTAEFKTLGGTILSTISGTTFILPASEKLIVLPRFTSQTQPDEITLTLGQTHFIQKPDVSFNFNLERVNLANNSSGLTVSAGITNLTAFTIDQISLPVTVYNNNNEIVAVDYTYINNVQSGETRTFQYQWPGPVSGALRAEINPEINIFDRNVFSTQAGVSPFANPTP